MSERLPRVTGPDVVRALERAGWKRTRQRGSHVRLTQPGTPGSRVTVPVHTGEILKPKTLHAILKQADLSVDALRQLL